ncbi:hypothetical protein, partial [Klebsiella pneumoniae]|uniref:hypothetical protein n=1 Tax=Klebsiella pneumoniae TaxID=573 RepID=UPI0025A2C4E6
NDGRMLMGGVWRLWHQAGFPLEMSYLLSMQNGIEVDWCEAMADASTDDNLPSLTQQLEGFLDDETMKKLKSGFMGLLREG